MENQIIHEFPMLISKASLYDGEMRWSAVNSDTDWDLYGERMTLELYKGMIAKIKSNVPPPEPFTDLVTSDYWKGGMPYLSIAHYSDGNGDAVPGEVRELFIDGNQLKAKGTLHDTKLGLAVWKSLKQDEINYKNGLDTERIRISIAFLDLAHKHGEDGAIFRRKSFTEVCPECQRGVGEKIYLDGYLVHLALTRVPVNPRTIIQEDVMTKRAKPTTKFEDAASVLGDETLADAVAKSGLEMKSEVLVEMSDTPAPEETPVTEPVQVEETLEVTKSQLADMVQELVAKALTVKSSDADEEDMSEGDKKKAKKEKMAEKSDTVSEVPVTKSALDLAVDELYNVVNGVISKAGTSEDKLQEVQPALQNLGSAIIATVKSSTNEPVAQPLPQNDAVLEAIQNLTSRVDIALTEVATIKAQIANPIAQNTNRVPVPRSIAPTVAKSDVPANVPTENPNSVKSIVRRSVGL
jgi:hypothetical protein